MATTTVRPNADATPKEWAKGALGAEASVTANPDANGNYTAWAGDYTAIDDWPDTSTDYISTITAAAKESWSNGNPSVPAGALITKVRLKVKGHVSAAFRNATITPILRISAVDYSGTNWVFNSTTVVEKSNDWATDPSTGKAWELAAVANLESGVIYVSGTGVCQTWSAQIEVFYRTTATTTHYTEVDEASADENTTYLAENQDQDEEWFELENPDTTGWASLDAIDVYMRGYEEVADAGIQVGWRVGAGTKNWGGTHALTGAYANYSSNWAAGLPAIGDLANLRVGLLYASGTAIAHVTQVYVVLTYTEAVAVGRSFAIII